MLDLKAKLNEPVKRKVLKCVLNSEETQFQNEIFKILPEMYKNNFQIFTTFYRRLVAVHLYNRDMLFNFWIGFQIKMGFMLDETTSTSIDIDDLQKQLGKK